MKKVLIALIGSLLLFTGCESNEKEVITTCNLTNNSATNYSVESEYKIYSKSDVVSKVETTEKVKSDNTAVLTYFEKYLKESYSKNNQNYGGYTNDVKIDGDTLTSTTEVDYSKMDLEKYAKDNSALKNYLNKDNKLTLEGVKTMYVSLGAVCE